MAKTRSLSRPQKELDSTARPSADHTLEAQVLSGVFLEQGISASILRGDTWHPIHHGPTESAVINFELAHRVERRRAPYNLRTAQKARRERRSILGEHAGFHDYFVPIEGPATPLNLVVAGPFAVAAPVTADLYGRWRWMTGRNARSSDPEFARYLDVTLAVPRLEGSHLETFRRLLECLALLVGGQGDATALAREGNRLRLSLVQARHAERMGAAVRQSVDEGSYRIWQSTHKVDALHNLGVKRFPEHALVGLLVSRDLTQDPIEDVLQRDAFFRTCVHYSRQRGGVLCGRIGRHGVVFLVDCAGAGSRTRARLSDWADRVRLVARRFGLRMHVGISALDSPFALPRRYQAALSAAESALSQGISTVVSSGRAPAGVTSPFEKLREQLAQAARESPELLAPRFERYLEAVAARSGYQVEAARAYLETGLARVMAALDESGALDERSLAELDELGGRMTANAPTVGELSVAYRKVVGDIQLALRRPRDARHDRSMRRAIAYIRDHFAQVLSLERVARVAGFARGYFSKLFVTTEGITFRDYVLRLRVERAKEMLAATTLSVERVGQLCGFRSRGRFYAAFKRLGAGAPREYRRRGRPT